MTFPLKGYQWKYFIYQGTKKTEATIPEYLLHTVWLTSSNSIVLGKNHVTVALHQLRGHREGLAEAIKAIKGRPGISVQVHLNTNVSLPFNKTLLPKCPQ